MSTPQFKAQAIARRERRKKVRRSMLDGCTNVTELAARFGVSATTISKDIKWVVEQWAKEDARMFANDLDRRRKRVAQLSQTIQRAVDSFERSKQDAEKTTVASKPATCDTCHGTGKVKIPNGPPKAKRKCARCEGTGRIMVDVETREVKGQAGDPAFLRVITTAVAEINKLEGLHQAPVQQHKVDGTIQHQHAHAVINVDDLKLPLKTRKELLAAIRSRGEDQSVIDYNPLANGNGHSSNGSNGNGKE